jgi:hypothetical protein
VRKYKAAQRQGFSVYGQDRLPVSLGRKNIVVSFNQMKFGAVDLGQKLIQIFPLTVPVRVEKIAKEIGVSGLKLVVKLLQPRQIVLMYRLGNWNPSSSKMSSLSKM